MNIKEKRLLLKYDVCMSSAVLCTTHTGEKHDNNNILIIIIRQFIKKVFKKYHTIKNQFHTFNLRLIE